MLGIARQCLAWQGEYMDYKKEYDDYFKKGEDMKTEAITCESPHRLTEIMLELEGYCLRLGQIISEMTIEYAKVFSRKKANDNTDKNAEALANSELYELYKVSMKDFDYLYKFQTKLVQAVKKRFQIIAFDYSKGQ